MIIGKTQSADGGFRRIQIRHTQIVDSETRKSLVDYLGKLVYQKCETHDWIGSSDLFPNIPDDLISTPLKVIVDLCNERFKDSSPQSIRTNITKYLGMLVREAVYYSDVRYFEEIKGSVRMYSLESKHLSNYNYIDNRNKLIYSSSLR